MVKKRFHSSEFSEIRDDSKLAEAVREYAAFARFQESLKSLRPGDVVKVTKRTETEPNASLCVFARFVCLLESERSVCVYLDGTEQKGQWSIPCGLISSLPPPVVRLMDQVLPPMEVKDNSLSPSGSALERRRAFGMLVHPSHCSNILDLAESGFGQVMDEIVAEQVSWMNGMCGQDVLALARAPQLELKDLYRARMAVRLFEEKRLLPVSKIESMIRIQAESLLESIDFSDIVGPERRRLVARLHDKVSTASSQVSAELKLLSQRLEENIAKLKPQIEGLQSGARKEKMTTDWLNLIRSRIMNELYRQGFKVENMYWGVGCTIATQGLTICFSKGKHHSRGLHQRAASGFRRNSEEFDHLGAVSGRDCERLPKGKQFVGLTSFVCFFRRPRDVFLLARQSQPLPLSM